MLISLLVPWCLLLSISIVVCVIPKLSHTRASSVTKVTDTQTLDDSITVHSRTYCGGSPSEMDCLSCLTWESTGVC